MMPSGGVHPISTVPLRRTSLELDADILAFFQSDPEPGDWRQHMNGVLRYYMETSQAMTPHPELAPDTDPAYEAERSIAMDAMTNRQGQEYETVHDGSWRSEEMPSDLDERHRQEWGLFERQWPEQAPAAAATPAEPKPPGLGL